MTFYESDKLIKLAEHVEKFEADAVITLIGVGNRETQSVDFNFVSKFSPPVAIDMLEQYLEHLRQEHISEVLNQKPNLNIVRE